jgi:hypothetical protein
VFSEKTGCIENRMQRRKEESREERMRERESEVKWE